MKKKILFLSLFGIIMFGIGVGASTLFSSNQVLYKNDKTVEEAINDLYAKSNIGDALASDIKAGKKALVGGKEVTGSLNVPSYTNLSGTQNVGAGAYSTLLNGYYNLSDYRIKCGSNSCSACNSCCSSTWKYGTFSCTSSTCDINIGFQPSILYAIGVDGADQAILTNTYNSSYSTSTTYSIWKVSNGTSFASYSMGTTKPGAIKYINSNGFTVTKSTNTNNWIYFAR